MNLQIAVNIAVGVLMPLVIFGLGYVVAISKDLATYKVHVAEHYVQKGEVSKLEAIMEAVRQQVGEISQTLHELKGRSALYERGKS